jgi:hypothetical protein
MVATPFPNIFEAFKPMGALSAGGPLQAMGELARIGANTAREVMQQQQAIALAAMNNMRSAAMATGAPSNMIEQSMEATRANTMLMVQNMGELAEIARKAQAELWAALSSQAGTAATASSDVVADALDQATAQTEDTLATAAKLVQ